MLSRIPLLSCPVWQSKLVLEPRIELALLQRRTSCISSIRLHHMSALYFCRKESAPLFLFQAHLRVCRCLPVKCCRILDIGLSRACGGVCPSAVLDARIYPLAIRTLPDVVSIPKTGEHFRMLFDVKGRYVPVPIKTEEASVSLKSPYAALPLHSRVNCVELLNMSQCTACSDMC